MQRNDMGHVHLGWRQIQPMVNEANMGFPHYAYVLSGGTGSGKTTTGLFPFLSYFKTKKLLIVQPTPANKTNVNYEFTQLLPPLLTQHELKRFAPLPKVHSVPLSSMATSGAGVYFCTASELLAYTVSVKSFPSADWILLDEYHLKNQNVYTLKVILQSRTLAKRFMLISATPDGMPTEQNQTPRNVTIYTINRPVEDYEWFDEHFDRSDLNPAKYMSYTANESFIVSTVLPTQRTLGRVAEYLRSKGLSTFVVDENTQPLAYNRMQKALVHGRHAVLMTPTVEAGITIPMDAFIDPAYTSSLMIDQSVLYEGMRVLSPAESSQRKGRAGRTRPTVIYANAVTAEAVETADLFLEANAIIVSVALGTDVTRYRGTAAVMKYPRLRNLTRACATSAMRDHKTQPFIFQYRYADNGARFLEMGGSEPGFTAACKTDLKLFVSNGPANAPITKIIASPIFDLADPTFDPYNFLPEARQQDVLTAIVTEEATRLDGMPFNQRCDILFSRFDQFAALVFQAFEGVCETGAPSTTSPAYHSRNAACATTDGRFSEALGGEGNFKTFMQRLTGMPNVEYIETFYQHIPVGTQRDDTQATVARDARDRADYDARIATMDDLVTRADDIVAGAVARTAFSTSLRALGAALDQAGYLNLRSAFADYERDGNQQNTGLAFENLVVNMTPIQRDSVHLYRVWFGEQLRNHTQLTTFRAWTVTWEQENQAKVTDETVRRDRLVAERAAEPAFAINPTPVQTGTAAEWRWTPAIQYTPTTGAQRVMQLAVNSRFTTLGTDGVQYAKTNEAAAEIFQILRPRIAAASLREIAPEKFVDLNQFIDKTPNNHTWFHANVH